MMAFSIPRLMAVVAASAGVFALFAAYHVPAQGYPYGLVACGAVAGVAAVSTGLGLPREP